MKRSNQPPRKSWRNRLGIIGILFSLCLFTLFLQVVQTWPPVVGLTLGLAVALLYAAGQWRQRWQQQQRLWRAFGHIHMPTAPYTVHALDLARQAPVLPPHQALIHAALALIWIYQGLVPKLMFPHTGELALMSRISFLQGNAALWVQIAGILEILFGLLFLWPRLARPLHILNILALLALGAGALFSQPLTLVSPFNPVSLSLAMAALSLVSLLTPDQIEYTEANR